MSVRTVTTTTTESPANTALDQPAILGLEALSLTEQMNNQLVAELNKTMETFRKSFAEMQNTLNATLQENQLLKKEIIQQNAAIKEMEMVHTAETKKNTQTIETLSSSVNTLTLNLSAEVKARKDLDEKFTSLVSWCNGHNHKLGFTAGPYANHYTNGPSSSYQTEKK